MDIVSTNKTELKNAGYSDAAVDVYVNEIEAYASTLSNKSIANAQHDKLENGDAPITHIHAKNAVKSVREQPRRQEKKKRLFIQLGQVTSGAILSLGLTVIKDEPILGALGFAFGVVLAAALIIFDALGEK
jgi:hypothetical protein